ncbi:MAG: flagellar biosynthesis protein FlhF, partial [Sulfurovum sp.]
MIHETFVASDPKTAYEQAVVKYGTDIELVSAKQIKYEDGKLRSEVVIAVPKDLFRQKSFVTASTSEIPPKAKEESLTEDQTLTKEIDALKSQLEEMKQAVKSEIIEQNDVAAEVRRLFIKKGITHLWLDPIMEGLIGSDILQDKRLLVSYLLEEIDESLKVKEEDLSDPKVMMLVGPTGVGKTTTIAKL